MKYSDFAVFVLMAGFYVAGTAAIGRIEVAGLFIKPGEIVSPLIALFGVPALLGFLFGQFMTNSASPFGPMDLITTAFALAGLLAIYFMRRRSVLLGALIYAVLTGVWTAYLISTATGALLSEALVAAVGGQLIMVIAGYLVYSWLRRLEPFRPIHAQSIEQQYSEYEKR